MKKIMQFTIFLLKIWRKPSFAPKVGKIFLSQGFLPWVSGLPETQIFFFLHHTPLTLLVYTKMYSGNYLANKSNVKFGPFLEISMPGERKNVSRAISVSDLGQYFPKYVDSTWLNINSHDWNFLLSLAGNEKKKTTISLYFPPAPVINNDWPINRQISIHVPTTLTYLMNFFLSMLYVNLGIE